MAGFLDKFRKNVISDIWKETEGESIPKKLDDKIALGVLLWVVAEADNKFIPEELEEIKEIIQNSTRISGDELEVVLKSVEVAAKERIDLYQFTSEISDNLNYSAKISIIEELFRVACADKDLAEVELEAIRKISGLFHISHKDFINAKIKVKKEFGLDTAGL